MAILQGVEMEHPPEELVMAVAAAAPMEVLAGVALEMAGPEEQHGVAISGASSATRAEERRVGVLLAMARLPVVAEAATEVMVIGAVLVLDHQDRTLPTLRSLPC